MDSSSPSGGDNMLTCSRPSSLMERRLRPQHDQALKCPRCDSTHTKFCYYNNYSLTQPRYFCKTCRRYWTKGGTLRNIPVGGGCRKNKKVNSSKKSSSSNNNESTIHIGGYNTTPSSSSSNPTDLHLSSFPHEVQLNSLLLGNPNPNNFMTMDDGIAGNKYNHNMMMLEIEDPSASLPIHDFMDNKFEALVGLSSRNVHQNDDPHDMMMGMFTPNHHNNNSSNYPFGMMMSVDGNSSSSGGGGGRLMLPYYGHQDPIIVNGLHHDDVKPNTKLLSLDWQGGGVGGSCSDATIGKDNNNNHNNFGYMNIGQWPGLMNGGGGGYGSNSATANTTTTNPLL